MVGIKNTEKDILGLIIKVVVLSMFFYHFWVAFTGVPEPLIVRPIHVSFVLFLGFVKFRVSSKIKTTTVPWYDWVLAILGAIGPLFILFDYERISWRMPFVDEVTTLDMVFGALSIVLVVELARRTVGKALSILVVAVIIYTLFGHYFPGILNQPGLDPPAFIDHLYLGSNGLFGSLTSLSLAEILMFIMFGAFLQASGGETLFNDFAVTATKNTIGGPAKAAVVGSALFGCISGSGVANVFATGSITIPLMKKAGYKPEFAGGVEAVSSSLGQLIPPVMGAGAFVIAEFAQRPYMEVAAAAVVPSILYVFAVFMAVHFEAKRQGIGKYAGGENVRPIKSTLLNYGHTLIPVVVLVAFLVQRRTAYYAATMATLSIIVISWLRKGTRITPKKFVSAAEAGIDRIVTIAATLIAAGIAVSALQTTGTIYKITSGIVQLANGKMLIAVILVAITTIILDNMKCLP